MTAVDDFGGVVNPMVAAGQAHGGLAQGIGPAPLTGRRRDDAMPRADGLPGFTAETARVIPCTRNPLGVKGGGDAGAIGSPPAVIHAICHALGVQEVPMPATPYTVWKAAQAAAAR